MPKRKPAVRFDILDPLLDGRIEDTLDLHRHDAATATVMVRGFVAASKRKYPGKIVRIMTGKGRQSLNGPVLKPLVKRLLHTELQRFVAESTLDLDEAGYLIRLK